MPRRKKKEEDEESEWEEEEIDATNGEDSSGRRVGRGQSFRRIKMHEMDRSYAPDLAKIGRYLMAVKSTRASSLAANLGADDNLGGLPPVVGQLWARRALWTRVQEISPALAKWLGTESIGLNVQGSVPKGMLLATNGSSKTKGQAQEVNQERRSKPVKEFRKRGRPSKEDLEERRRKLLEKEKLIADTVKPITVNERLHSLVDRAVAVAATSEETLKEKDVSKQQEKKRRAINNKAADDNNPTPSTSAARQPTKALKRPKLEMADFQLPSEIFAGLPPAARMPKPKDVALSTSTPVQPTVKQKEKEKEERKKTTTKGFRGLGKTMAELAAIGATVQQNQQQQKEGEEQEDRGSQTPVKKGQSKKNHLSPLLPRSIGGKVQLLPAQAHFHCVRLPIFTARTFPFDVDISPAVQKFESVQLVDIFNTLPAAIPSQSVKREREEEQSSLRKQGPAGGDGRLQTSAANGTPSSVDSASFSNSVNHCVSVASRLDRWTLRQGKGKQRRAQALFCGGPVASIRSCPRRLDRDREMIAVSTFLDECMLTRLVDEEDRNSFVQFWTLKSTDLSECARLAFLLRVQNAAGLICSMDWCPVLMDCDEFSLAQSIRQQNTDLSERSNGRREQPIGLLAIGTAIGRIHIYGIPNELDDFLGQFTSASVNTGEGGQQPLVLHTNPLLTLRHPPTSVAVKAEANAGTQQKREMDSFPLLSLRWSPFTGSRYLAAVSTFGSVHIWDLLAGLSSSAVDNLLPLCTMPLEDWMAPAMSICWMDWNMVCISSRHRQIRVYRLDGLSRDTNTDAKQNTAVPNMLWECDIPKTCGSLCYSQPLVFPGLISFDSSTFNYLGYPTMAPSYIWGQTQPESKKQPQQEGEFVGQICATNLSNCHQVRISDCTICPLTGMCASVGADGRLSCSLNGRMIPKEGLPRETENFMHGRVLLQLVEHRKKEPAEDESDQEKKESKFCHSHADCCAEKWLEVRLGDCALLEQQNERSSTRRAQEVCIDRRLEGLTAVEFSQSTAGLTFCGSESGCVFIVPSTL